MVITPGSCVVITPGPCVAIIPSSRKKFVREWLLLDQALDLAFITPSTLKVLGIITTPLCSFKTSILVYFHVLCCVPIAVNLRGFKKRGCLRPELGRADNGLHSRRRFPRTHHRHRHVHDDSRHFRGECWDDSGTQWLAHGLFHRKMLTIFI